MVIEDCLQLVFHSPEPEDNLKTIEVLNAPAELKTEGRYQVNAQVSRFFESFVANELFRFNRALSLYSFESLKIWLCNGSGNNLQGRQLPAISHKSITLPSHLTASQLKQIIVLDIDLDGNQRMLWEDACKELLRPLFGKFIAPAEPPDVLKEFLTMRLGSQLSDRLNLYFNMREHMPFDSFIVQAK